MSAEKDKYSKFKKYFKSTGKTDVNTLVCFSLLFTRQIINERILDLEEENKKKCACEKSDDVEELIEFTKMITEHNTRIIDEHNCYERVFEN